MAELVLAAMTLSAVLYALFGGADFGAGMIDLMLGARVRERVDVAIAPVWEANHVWLILVVVLAFVGFPRAYTEVSTLLHVPLALALLGIVARGSAFTFRHYDPSERHERGYTRVFHLGSVLTPLCLGFVLAGISGGALTRDLTLGFYAVFVAPWNSLFGWSVGVFVCALFAFEGAALLAAEHARDDAPLPYLRLARRLHVATFVAAASVLGSAYADRVPWLDGLLGSPLALAAGVLALLVTPGIARAFERGDALRVRLFTGAQLVGVTLAFFAAQFPVIVRIAGGDVRFPDAAAVPSVLRALCWALGVGLAAIVPALAYLVTVYKRAPLGHD